MAPAVVARAPGSVAGAAESSAATVADDAPDLERRFGALARLYGSDGYARLRAARVAVVGLGGVGSWAVEALARSGVAELTLVDYDHVAESNINRQVQALGATVGAPKGQALAERIADIHPACRIHLVDDFAGPSNWPALLPQPVDGVIDACDQVNAKLALAQWALQQRLPFVCVGAAGGKRQAQAVALADLAEVTHDPLLAALRSRLRRAQRGDAVPSRSNKPRRLGLRCVYSSEAVQRPTQGDACEAEGFSGGLNCAGYGSSVTVTATFGMVAAGELLQRLAAGT